MSNEPIKPEEGKETATARAKAAENYLIYKQAFSTVLGIVIAGCITTAAIRFDDPRLLWFLILAAFCAI